MTRSFLTGFAPLALGAAIALNAACGGPGSVTGPTPSQTSPAPSPSPSPSPSPAPAPSTPSCTTTVVGLPSTVSAASGRYAFAVSTPSTCAWTASKDVSWVDIAPGSGQGDTPMIAGQRVNVTQQRRGGA